MKNTKGFTLIELLAVIVILAIIALIVTPVVSDIILSARIAANARSVEGHVRNIELAIISEAFNAETGDLTQYDVTEGALKTTLTLPNNDTVECAKYTILNGTVMRAWDCKPKTGSNNKNTQGLTVKTVVEQDKPQYYEKEIE